MTATMEVPDVREYPAADRDGAADPAGAPALGRALVTPDTDGRWTLAAFVLVLVFCIAVWFGLLYAVAPTAFDPDWSGFGPYRGWEARP